ncbi:MAG: HAMP domain-containing histidine kinase [Rhodocyclaceae bacterium]|nr:HAMP domain-containing histidine kinase [Rhodocyclaceae bacterium]
MKASLARRLFRTIFAIGLINVLVALIAVEYIYEDLEDTILRLELAEERAFFENRITGATPQSWHTALLTAQYVPDGHGDAPLAEAFQGRAAPFSAEVEIGERTYLISIERTEDPGGILYLAQDITLLEDREDTLQVGMVLLGLCMLLFGFVLARIGTRRIVGPLHALTRHLAEIRPGSPIARIENGFEDDELRRIANTLNRLLDALDAYVQREKSLVSLASHELRTPVAVISGALDVLEQRNSLGESDRRTVARIRRAADEMGADVDALLKLARRSAREEQRDDIRLANSVREVITEIESSNPNQRGRMTIEEDGSHCIVRADPSLVRMLLRNLIQNAIRHTNNCVIVALAPTTLVVRDYGTGLPQAVQTRMSGPADRSVPEDGLGLFIVRLICERLGWRLRIRTSGATGTEMEIAFGHPSEAPESDPATQ